MLGCGETKAYLAERGGATIITELPWTSISYGRVLDEISSASITVPMSAANPWCARALGDIGAFQHELVIYRDGDQVWVGPVSEDVAYTDEQVIFGARDVFAWLERRLIEQDIVLTGIDLMRVFEKYVEAGLARENSMGIRLRSYPTGILGDREALEFDFRRAADELRELSRTGIDFTVINRDIIAWGEDEIFDELPTLTTDQISDGTITQLGAFAVSEVVVLGDRSGGETIIGKQGGIDEDIGLVQMTLQEPAIRDDASARQSAASRLAAFRGRPHQIEGRLLDRASAKMEQLIPGSLWPVAVEIGAKRLVETMRLMSVSVNSQVSDEGVTEEVRVMVGPKADVNEVTPEFVVEP